MTELSERALEWIDKLGLAEHPEGGYFAEVYRSELNLPHNVLPEGFTGTRDLVTSIYYLLAGEDFSSLHRIKSDEIWHFHEGAALTIEAIDPVGKRHTWTLGLNVECGQVPMAVVPAGYWFGAHLADEAEGHTLVGCTVSPGFDFTDFELANRSELESLYPLHSDLIQRLTRS